MRKPWAPGGDILWMVLDSLRYDVAVEALEEGLTPTLAGLLPQGHWQRRTTSGSFTYAAHQAFFAGFLPTPTEPGLHPRRFACRFPGSLTVGPDTLVMESASVPEGLAALGYRTLCVGGVGFFNPGFPLGRVLPGYFQESHWSPETSVSSRDCTAHQVAWALERLAESSQQVFLFMNLGVTHEPTRGYLPGATEESRHTQKAALAYADAQLAPLLPALRARGTLLAMACADHGTCFGEDGYHGHRQAHPAVWTVPYTEIEL